MTLAEYSQIYSQNLTESVIPFWLKHSIDHKNGGYFSCLDRHGKVYDTRKYVWMQGRAVWMFCRLYNEYEKNPQYLETARGILTFLLKHCFDEKGRCYFSLTPAGAPAFFQRKPYAAVFVALALIEYAKATGEEKYLEQAKLLFDDICASIADPRLLGRPSLPGALAYTQLADIMVIAAVALELHSASPRQIYLDILSECTQAIWPHYDPANRLLMENAAPKNHHFRDHPEGRLICPGSSLEVSWFLLHALRTVPDSRTQTMLLDAIEGALEYGWDKEHGGIYYFMDAEGRPPLALESNMKLWWPHTEAIYASVLAYTITGDKKHKHWLDRIHNYTFKTFVDEEFGEWFGYCDRQGNVALNSKGGPYKGVFHVPRCLLFSIQAINKSTAPKYPALHG